MIINLCQQLALSAGSVEYSNCISSGGKTPPTSVLIYDTKQSDGEAPVMLEPLGMQSTSSLPLLLGPLGFVEVAPNKALPMGQIKLFGI